MKILGNCLPMLRMAARLTANQMDPSSLMHTIENGRPFENKAFLHVFLKRFHTNDKLPRSTFPQSILTDTQRSMIKDLYKLNSKSFVDSKSIKQKQEQSKQENIRKIIIPSNYYALQHHLNAGKRKRFDVRLGSSKCDGSKPHKYLMSCNAYKNALLEAIKRKSALKESDGSTKIKRPKNCKPNDGKGKSIAVECKTDKHSDKSKEQKKQQRPGCKSEEDTCKTYHSEKQTPLTDTVKPSKTNPCKKGPEKKMSSAKAAAPISNEEKCKNLRTETAKHAIKEKPCNEPSKKAGTISKKEDPGKKEKTKTVSQPKMNVSKLGESRKEDPNKKPGKQAATKTKKEDSWKKESVSKIKKDDPCKKSSKESVIKAKNTAPTKKMSKESVGISTSADSSQKPSKEAVSNIKKKESCGKADVSKSKKDEPCKKSSKDSITKSQKDASKASISKDKKDNCKKSNIAAAAETKREALCNKSKPGTAAQTKREALCNKSKPGAASPCTSKAKANPQPRHSPCENRNKKLEQGNKEIICGKVEAKESIKGDCSNVKNERKASGDCAQLGSLGMHPKIKNGGCKKGMKKGYKKPPGCKRNKRKK